MGLSKVKIGEDAPKEVNVVVEIPRGCPNKYEYSEEDHEIHLDRILHSAVFFPTDYGFIPETRSGDGDHLDIFVVVSEPTFPGCVLRVKPIGLIDMEDESGQDCKVVGVAVKDPHSKDVKKIDEHLKNKIKNFLETYKNLEDGKWAKVKKYYGEDEAHKEIIKSLERYKSETSNKQK